MPINAAAMVGPSEIRVRRGQGLITCLALRTGACVCLYDPESNVGGMAHITHSERNEMHPNRPGKFACSGIDALIQNMERAGANRTRLLAVLVGGAEVSVHDGEEGTEPLIIDAGVCRSAMLELERQHIPLIGKEVGGKSDRNVTLDVSSGFVRVKSQNEEKPLCRLEIQDQQAIVA
jgi:chemotaxis protein CheD